MTFTARYSEYRGMTFRFDATCWKTARVLSWALLLPLLVVGIGFVAGENPALPGMVGVVVFAGLLLFPTWLARMKRFLAGHTSFGGQAARCTVSGGALWSIYFRAGLLAVPLGGLAFLAGFVAVKFFDAPFPVIVALSLTASGATSLVLAAYLRARTQNAVWNATTLGPLRFTASLGARELATIYLTNTLAILCSAGLATPWAVIRTLRYRTEHTCIENAGDLAGFARQGHDADVQAASAETADLFDMDLSLRPRPRSQVGSTTG